MKKTTPQRKKGHAGAKLTTLVAAAGLVAAAVVYLRRRGIDPKTELKKLGLSAKGAAQILRGESKTAYDELRSTVIAQLATRNEKPTRQVVLATVDALMATVRKHAGMSATQLKPIPDQLKAEWQDIRTRAVKQKTQTDS